MVLVGQTSRLPLVEEKDFDLLEIHSLSAAMPSSSIRAPVALFPPHKASLLISVSKVKHLDYVQILVLSGAEKRK